VPELPEVETIRRDLDRELSGRVIERVVSEGARSIRRHDPVEFVCRLLGRTVVTVDRRGKYLVFHLDEGALVIHLGMSGQLLLASPELSLARHTHVVLGFSGDRDLRFVDPRTFGEAFVSGPELGELSRLGVDPLSVVSASQLGSMLAARTTKLKPLLMDQHFLAGIGNIYSDEILFTAHLRYDRSAATLTPTEVRRLYRAMVSILEAGIEHRGSSLSDEQYRDVFGVTGSHQNHHQVYAREGKPCRRCHQPIIRVKLGGRSTFLCPRCQPAILRDFGSSR